MASIFIDLRDDPELNRELSVRAAQLGISKSELATILLRAGLTGWQEERPGNGSTSQDE